MKIVNKLEDNLTKTIVITPGCPSGIGPEVIVKSFAFNELPTNVDYLFTGNIALLKEMSIICKLDYFIDENTFTICGKYGHFAVKCLSETHYKKTIWQHPCRQAIKIQTDGVLKAISLAKKGKIDAVVTAPLRKRACFNVDGQIFYGHTKLLHYCLGQKGTVPLMYFSGASFLLGLATDHLPINQVAKQITKNHIINMAKALLEAAGKYYQLKPQQIRLAILGLNPHAGEGGIIGCEEENEIKPAIVQLKRQGFNVFGPLPADSFFIRTKQLNNSSPHAVLAMSHDQGLAPYKLLCDNKGVNITHGLNIIRTSPDHGTADDIAGRGIANCTSMTHAICDAYKLSRNNCYFLDKEQSCKTTLSKHSQSLQ